LRVFRPTLDHLFAFRKAAYLGDKLPTLLIAAPGRGRVEAWWEFLADVREARWDYPLPVYVAAWEDLPTDDERLLTQSRQLPTEELRRTFRIDPLRLRRPSSLLPHPVGDALRPSGRPHAAACLEHVALALVPSDRELLALVGSHPFLPPQAMATVLGWQISRVRKHRRRLTERGLMRLVGADEIGREAALELGESERERRHHRARRARGAGRASRMRDSEAGPSLVARRTPDTRGPSGDPHRRRSGHGGHPGRRALPAQAALEASVLIRARHPGRRRR
jgi:hypothetical protein